MRPMKAAIIGRAVGRAIANRRRPGDSLANYDPSQARDEGGRWTDEGVAGFGTSHAMQHEGGYGFAGNVRGPRMGQLPAEKVKALVPVAVRAVIEKAGVTEKGAHVFLQSPSGRHFGDEVSSAMHAGEAPEIAIQKLAGARHNVGKARELSGLPRSADPLFSVRTPRSLPATSDDSISAQAQRAMRDKRQRVAPGQIARSRVRYGGESEYQFTHKTAPRGSGRWSFALHDPVSGRDATFTHNGPYSQAKVLAIHHAAGRGFPEVRVET